MFKYITFPLGKCFSNTQDTYTELAMYIPTFICVYIVSYMYIAIDIYRFRNCCIYFILSKPIKNVKAMQI